MQLRLLSMLLMTVLPVRAEDTLVLEWEDLWQGCMVSILEGVPFDARAMRPLKTSYQLLAPALTERGIFPPSVGAIIPHQRWRTANGSFEVLEREERQANGMFSPSCTVELAGGVRLTENQERDLAERFKARAGALVEKGMFHHWPVEPHGTTSLAIRSNEQNYNGCTVVSALFIDRLGPATPTLSTVTGEQAGDCGTSARFDWPGRSPLHDGDLEDLLDELAQALGEESTGNPMDQQVGQCVQSELFLCTFDAFGGQVRGLTKSTGESDVYSMYLQTGRGAAGLSGLKEVLRATIKLFAPDTPASSGAGTLETLERGLSEDDLPMQLQLGRTLWVIDDTPHGVTAGIARVQ